jgi:ribosomal protein L7/L12
VEKQGIFMDIRELSERVNQLSYRVSKLEQALASMGGEFDPPSGFSEDPPGSEYPDVMEALQRGNLIEAIKLYRQYTGVGLAEAKEIVEGLIGR